MFEGNAKVMLKLKNDVVSSRHFQDNQHIMDGRLRCPLDTLQYCLKDKKMKRNSNNVQTR
jgi:hypothetical protein